VFSQSFQLQSCESLISESRSENSEQIILCNIFLQSILGVTLIS